MKWRSIRHLQGTSFKRLVGVNRTTFEKMVSEATRLTNDSQHKVPGKKRGPKSSLSKKDEVLMLLMYYRESIGHFIILLLPMALVKLNAGGLLPA
jgi:hypothetical protein